MYRTAMYRTAMYQTAMYQTMISRLSIVCISVLFSVNGSSLIAVETPAVETGEASAVQFKKLVLTHEYYCDGIAAGDINGDEHLDIVAGPYWYEGPSFESAHEFYPAVAIEKEPSPSNSMFSFVRDFNGDGHQDILVLGRVHKHAARWYENPGGKQLKKAGVWQSHFVFDFVRGESPMLADVDRDGLPELLTHWDGRWGMIEPKADDPYAAWLFHPVGADEQWKQFYHGEGFGDVNLDGRLDLIINDGWYEHPEDSASEEWPFHRNRFSEGRGGAQMFAYDVDGDGDNDVVTAADGHGWGLEWYEQLTTAGAVQFKRHKIMGDRSQETQFGVAFSQPHALDLCDIDGDGLKDILVGKRMWAHGPEGDVEPNADPVLYWFQLQRDPEGQVQFVPRLIDKQSGVGTQVQAIDVNGDDRLDVLTVSKLGTFVFLNQGSAE